MIGVLRAVKFELPPEYRRDVERTHCGGCVYVKENANRVLSLFYIYETDFLLYLFYGFNRLRKDTRKIFWTGFPIVRKEIFDLSESESKIVFAFSVIAAYAFLDDKKRDDNSKKAGLFLKFLDKHLDSSLILLNDDTNIIFNPRRLSVLKENEIKNIDELCLLYRPLISNLYFNALIKLGIKCNIQMLKEITDRISDLLIYTDSIADFYGDKAKNQFNIILNEDELKITYDKLKHNLSELSLFISTTSEPWRKIMTNVLSYGVINYINKNWEKR